MARKIGPTPILTGKKAKHFKDEMKRPATKAEKEYLQLTPKETQKLETGKKQLTVSTIDKLCKLYGCSEEYILCQNNFYDPHQFIHNKNELKDLGAIASMNTIISNIQFLDKAYQDFKTNLIKELEK